MFDQLVEDVFGVLWALDPAAAAYLGKHDSEVSARKEAERGTFDPGYFSYTVGKLQTLKLRDDYQAHAGRDYSLKDFHDRLLSRGAPPVEMMRRVMLP